MLAGDRRLCGDNLHLDRGHELFRLSETKPEVGQTGLPIAFEACDLYLRRLPGLQRRTSFATNSPSSREPRTYQNRNEPHRIACFRAPWHGALNLDHILAYKEI